MGNPKQKWTAEEEEALRAGVAKHGVGKWKLIQRDPVFNQLLFSRSNIDLKDKWRNLSVANGQGPRDKSKPQKSKVNPVDAPAAPLPIALPIAQPSASVTPSAQDATTTDIVMVDSKPLPEGNNAAKYNSMIYEALSTLKEPNGSQSGAIATYIEQRYEVPQKFKRVLSSRLRRLVEQDKLEKVQNCFKIKGDAPPVVETKIPPVRPKESWPRQAQSTGYIVDTVEEACSSAAYKVAEAENKSFVAAEAVKEAERVAMMAEEMESLLQFATECYEQTARGEVILLRPDL